MSGSFDRFRKSRDVDWEKPPAEASRRARRRPDGQPLPLPGESVSQGGDVPDDVRSARVEGAGGMISRSLDRVNVTFLLRPPTGDGLWTLQGRAWFEEKEPVRVALVQGENVLDETVIESGGSFHFQDVLLRQWTLEFHFADGHVAVLRHAE
jgi:hypothetical protein